MSGHSKWATIKRKKEATDAKRSNMYAKLLRAIEVAAREGGGSVEGNMTLASAVEKAKSFSVPNDNIDRAIKRGTGELGGGQKYEEVVYEGYAPGGIAVMIEALTDNRNRTATNVRTGKPRAAEVERLGALERLGCRVALLGFYTDARWQIHVFPRAKHRPSFYFKEGEEQLLFSPAAVELGGICTTPRERDFEKVTREHIIEMYQEVCVSAERFAGIMAQLRPNLPALAGR